jgi:predicted Zn-dependent protease
MMRAHFSMPAFRRLALVAVAVVSLLPMTGCVMEPITGRWLLGLIPESEANEMGALAYEQALKDATLSTDTAQVDRVRRVGERIAAVVDGRMGDDGQKPFDWEFRLVDADDVVNAFALPGGKVAFYTGILAVCRDETGIAVVMGHEIGHAYGQHGRARVSQNIVAQAGMAAVMVALESDEPSETSQLAMAALGVGYQIGIELPFSRDDESAADHIGLILMAEAGYDPREAVDFWQRMAEATGGGGTPEFLSTHPSPETRVKQLEKLMPEAMVIYERTKGLARGQSLRSARFPDQSGS